MPWGAAIGAIGAIGAAEVNKSGKSGGSSTSESPGTRAASDDALGRAQTIAGTPYQAYTGQVVANMSQNEKAGSALASPDSANNKLASSLYNQAAGDIAGIKQYNSENLKSYMDPYVQATLNPVLTRENVNYQTQRSALENSKAGAFGGDRSALQEYSLEKAHSEADEKAIGDAYSSAYTNAQTAFFQDQNKQINAAKALDEVGGDVSKLNTEQIQDLMATGGVARALEQQQLNFNLNTFTTAQNWSTTQLQPLLQAIAASKGVQTNTQLYAQPNVAGEALGAAATVAGAYFTGRPSSPNAPVQSSPTVVSNSTYSPGETAPTPTVQEYDSGTTTTWDGSDQRLKTDVVQIGVLPSGLAWYEFRYIYDADRRLHQGVIAQEVLPVMPEAVLIGEDGFLRVNYGRIH